MFLGFGACSAGFVCYLICSNFLFARLFFPSLPGRGEPGGSSLFFASPKKSNQKKGDPQSGTLWATCAAPEKRGSAQTRLRLKQRAALIPLF